MGTSTLIHRQARGSVYRIETIRAEVIIPDVLWEQRDEQEWERMSCALCAGSDAAGTDEYVEIIEWAEFPNAGMASAFVAKWSAEIERRLAQLGA